MISIPKANIDLSMFMKLLRPFILNFVFLIAFWIDCDAQKLASFSYSQCDENNPYRWQLATRINSQTREKNSTTLNVTLVTVCSLDTKFLLEKIVGDTLFLTYGDSGTYCKCSYNLKLVLRSIAPDHLEFKTKKYIIKLNNRTIPTDVGRYYGFMSASEYFESSSANQKHLKRELHFKDGILMAETFYGPNGNIISENYFYNGIYKSDKKFSPD